MTINPFTLTIDFSEALNLTDNNNPVLTESDITPINTNIDSFTINNSGDGEKGKIVIEATILDLTGDQPTLTISNGSYGDAQGNVGSEYTLNLNIDGLLLANQLCERFLFDGGSGTDTDPYYPDF